MQKLLLTISLLLTASIIYAQTPQAIKYQAVARGESGDVIADADVSFRFSIVEGSPNGPSIYVETHSVTSNEFGLVNLNVGRGNAVTGSFSNVEWETGSYFLKVELDPDGGSSYNEMGTSELLTVPYAFHAGSADDVDDDDADPTNELITRLELIGAGLEIEEGGQVQTVNLSSLINDADADPSNELISEFEFRNDSIIITEAGVERAVEIDGFFSGEYEDLTGKPVFQDSINQYGFSGVYDSLSNLPNFQDSINTYGFDGDYNSLINQPDITDSINTYGVINNVEFRNDSVIVTEGGIEYGDIVTGFFSGDYGDLSNKPSFQDSVDAYGFSGDYGDLTNQPSFPDSINAYGFDGDYNSLSNLPDFQDSINTYGFDGDYNSLSNLPSFQDSINTYGFDGDYNSLVNQPDITDSINTYGVINNVEFRNDSVVVTEGGIEYGDIVTGFFSGDYGDLANKPSFQDSINSYGFSGDYGDLTNKPSFQDSINTYGFDGDYNSLINQPDITDSINTYGVINNVEFRNDSVIVTEGGIEHGDIVTGFFSGDYGDLANKPSFQDSVDAYGFDGNYLSLTNKPNFQDSFNVYGFSGEYDSLQNTPDIVDSINTYGVITSTSFSNDSLFITEGGTTFDVDLSSLQGAPQDLELNNDTLTITDHQSATPIDLTPYRSKWNENASGDLFSHKNIGLGVETPGYKLEVSDTLTPSNEATAVFKSYHNNTSVSNGTPTVLVQNTAEAQKDNVGVKVEIEGDSTSLNRGIVVNSKNSFINQGLRVRTGSEAGTQSFTNNEENIGVFTTSGGGSVHNYSTYSAVGEPVGDFNIGVWGHLPNNMTADNFAAGGYFSNFTANNANNFGVYATTGNSTGTNYAVFAETFGSSGTNVAGHFIGDVEVVSGNVSVDGDLNVTGNISKGGGTFRIDHPLDPKNKELVHSFVESPDMMNVYNGNTETDGDGYATVELPEYFEKANKDFRYQLTVVGTFAQAIVKEKIKNNRFVIQTDEPNVEVSWQVTGIRNDPYAQKNRIQPEREKQDEKRGKYIHPEVYGVEKQDRNKRNDVPRNTPPIPKNK